MVCHHLHHHLGLETCATSKKSLNSKLTGFFAGLFLLVAQDPFQQLILLFFSQVAGEAPIPRRAGPKFHTDFFEAIFHVVLLSGALKPGFRITKLHTHSPQLTLIQETGWATSRRTASIGAKRRRPARGTSQEFFSSPQRLRMPKPLLKAGGTLIYCQGTDPKRVYLLSRWPAPAEHSLPDRIPNRAAKHLGLSNCQHLRRDFSAFFTTLCISGQKIVQPNLTPPQKTNIVAIWARSVGILLELFHGPELFQIQG